MIEKKEYLTAVCDECGENFDCIGEGGFTVFESKEEMIGMLKESGWIVNGENFCCPDCKAEEEAKNSAKTNKLKNETLAGGKG
jgi:hypothetical protein